jgi:pimeloyl-ACP methyl ester carboxylesterase
VRVQVGDVKLFVEVVGQKLAIEGDEVVERPTMVMVHGGPNWDHLTLLPEHRALADVAQLVFYDHRGLGRSDEASAASWTLKQWAADLGGLIDVLGLDRPIIFGQSFGGMVAQQLAIDYPGICSGLILSATTARFNLPAVVENYRRLAGDEAAELAQAYYTAPTPEQGTRFRRDYMPLYTVARRKIGTLSPDKPAVRDHFFSPRGDVHHFDFRAGLAAVDVPVLVIAGDSDPVTPAEGAAEMAASFVPGIARLEIFERCGHGPARDRPDVALDVIRDFVRSLSQPKAGQPSAEVAPALA